MTTRSRRSATASWRSRASSRRRGHDHGRSLRQGRASGGQDMTTDDRSVGVGQESGARDIAATDRITMAIQYPLSAIVGQQPLIEALLVNAVSPEVGGVLVRGERGTAKSTAVRALAPLLPAVQAAVGETYAFGPGQAAPGGTVASGAVTELRAAPLVEL